jgi:hypothetical protein
MTKLGGEARGREMVCVVVVGVGVGVVGGRFEQQRQTQQRQQQEYVVGMEFGGVKGWGASQ